MQNFYLLLRNCLLKIIILHIIFLWDKKLSPMIRGKSLTVMSLLFWLIVFFRKKVPAKGLDPASQALLREYSQIISTFNLLDLNNIITHLRFNCSFYCTSSLTQRVHFLAKSCTPIMHDRFTIIWDIKCISSIPFCKLPILIWEDIVLQNVHIIIFIKCWNSICSWINSY